MKPNTVWWDGVYHFVDARAVNIFGGVDGSAFLNEVQCSGSEEKLTVCPIGGTGDDGCGSAGVTCRRSTSESTILTQVLLHLSL